MTFVQFTQPDDQPIVINTERIITAAPAPPDGQGTRITFTNGGHQDVKELIRRRAEAVEHQSVKLGTPPTALSIGGKPTRAPVLSPQMPPTL